MRILILNTFPSWGGDEKWTINVALGLMRMGHYVVVSSRPGSETDRQARTNNIVAIPFQIGPDIAFWKIFPFQRILKHNSIDVVLCVQNPDIKIGGLAARLAKIPAIFARQGMATIRKKAEHKYVFTRYLDGIITNTKSIKDLYDTWGWFPPDFIHVVYDGLELETAPARVDIHKELDLNPGSRVIIAAGRLCHQKRFDLLIEVARIIKKKNLIWDIVVIGTGKLEADLKAQVEKYDVKDIIRFVGFRTDVLNLFYSSDLFVLSSDAEGMSNALREAMAVGLPCVATDVYGVEELFQNGKNGLMVEKGNADAIFNGIEAVFADGETAAHMGASARERILSTFTMSQMIKELEKLFQDQLLKSGKI